MVVYLEHHAELVDHRVHVANKFFSVRRQSSGDAKGLFECLKQAVKYVGLHGEWYKKLIGFGCDGTSVNIGGRGLKIYLEQTAPCIEVFWCLAHRLELSLKDALKDTLFSTIDEMLLRVYYLYTRNHQKSAVN